MKVSGKEFKEWFDNHFPEGFYIDDESPETPLHDEKGKWLLEDGVKYDADDLGILIWEGDGNTVDPTGGNNLAISTAIRRWRTQRDYELVVVKIKKSDIAVFKAVIEANGWRVEK